MGNEWNWPRILFSVNLVMPTIGLCPYHWNLWLRFYLECSIPGMKEKWYQIRPSQSRGAASTGEKFTTLLVSTSPLRDGRLVEWGFA
jgi:hypothetical protein